MFEENLQEETLEEELETLAFQGEYSFPIILESITKQFNDYTHNKDRTNYVDIFYDQMKKSFKIIEEEKPPQSDVLIEILNKFMDIFISTMNTLINKTLTISIGIIESGEENQEELEYIFRKIYDVLILYAKKNFETVIVEDILGKVNLSSLSDEEFFDKIEMILHQYDPLILEIGPMEFLRIIRDEELIELFNSNKINGNFLRRYTPKIYQNDEFKMELINNIILKQSGEDL